MTVINLLLQNTDVCNDVINMIEDYRHDDYKLKRDKCIYLLKCDMAYYVNHIYDDDGEETLLQYLKFEDADRQRERCFFDACEGYDDNDDSDEEEIF